MVNKERTVEFIDAETLILPENLKKLKKGQVVSNFTMCGPPLLTSTILSESWDSQTQGCAMLKICQKLKGLKLRVRELNNSQYSEIEVRLNQKMLELQQLILENRLNSKLQNEELCARSTHLKLSKNEEFCCSKS